MNNKLFINDYIAYVMLLSLSIITSFLFIAGENNVLIHSIVFLLAFIVIFKTLYKYHFLKTTFFFFSMFYLMLFFPFVIFFPLLEIDNISNISLYSFMTINGYVLLFITYSIIANKQKYKNLIVFFEIEYKKINMLIKILLLMFIIGFLLLLLDHASMNIFNMTRADHKEATTIKSMIAVYLYNISAILFLFMGVLFQTNKKPYMIFIVVMLIEFLSFFILKSRYTLITHISAFVMGYMFFYQYIRIPNIVINRKKINKSKALIFLIIIALLAINMRFYRSYIGNDDLDVSTNENIGFFLNIANSIRDGDFGITPVVLEIMDNYPSNYKYLYGQTFYRLLFIHIPRSAWESKPESTPRILGKQLRPNAKNMTLGAGIVGESYINFSYFGIMLFIVIGLVLALFDLKRYNFTYYIVLSVSITSIFNINRGLITSPIIIMSVLFIGAVLVFLYLKPKKIYKEIKHENN